MGAAELGGGVGDGLQQDGELELGGDQFAGAFENLQDSRFFLESRCGLFPLGDVAGDFRNADDAARQLPPLTGETVSETSIREPSFRTRTVS